MAQIINPPTVNYMPQQGQDFMQSYLEGLKFGQDLQAFKKQQELNAKQQLFQQDYANLMQNPSGKGMLNLMVNYPEFAANLKPIQDTYATAEKQGELSTILQIDNAMTNNNFPLAKKLVEQAKVAFANAGKDTKNLDIVLQTIDESPETAKGSIEMTAAMLLGDKYKTFQEAKTEQLTQSLKVKELEAKIVKLNAEGKFEEAKALGEQLKNQASAAAKIDLSLLPGLSESIMQIETNPNAALTTLKSERIYAYEQGADPYVYDKAIRFIENGDLPSAKAVISSQLSKSPDYKNIIAGHKGTLIQSSEVSQAKSKAKQEQIRLEYLEPELKLKIQKEKVDINKILEDTKLTKLAQKAKSLEIASDKELNPLKKQKLQLEVLNTKDEYNSKVNQKASELYSSRTTIKNTIETIDDLLGNPELDSIVGTIKSKKPNWMMTDNEIDAKAQLETIGSQAFLSQVGTMKGMGALSNAEGDKLQAAISNLKREQSFESMKKNLNIVKDIMYSARKTIDIKYTGKKVDDNQVPVTKNSSKGSVEKYLKQYGGNK